MKVHFSPIARLPVELMANIFELEQEQAAYTTLNTLWSDTLPGDPISTRRLTRVCKSWRVQVIQNSRLWRILPLDTMSSSSLALSLIRSQTTSLYVFICQARAIPLLSKVLGSEHARVALLSISLEEFHWSFIRRTMSSLEFPALHSVALRPRPSQGGGANHLLHGTQGPSRASALSTLIIRDTFIRLDRLPPYSTLRRVHLHGSHIQEENVPVPLTEFIRLLPALTSLDELELWRIDIDDNLAVTPPISTNLKRLFINSSPRAINALCRSIRCNDLRAITIWCPRWLNGGANPSSTDVIEAISHFTTTHKVVAVGFFLARGLLHPMPHGYIDLVLISDHDASYILRLDETVIDLFKCAVHACIPRGCVAAIEHAANTPSMKTFNPVTLCSQWVRFTSIHLINPEPQAIRDLLLTLNMEDTERTLRAIFVYNCPSGASSKAAFTKLLNEVAAGALGPLDKLSVVFIEEHTQTRWIEDGRVVDNPVTSAFSVIEKDILPLDAATFSPTLRTFSHPDLLRTLTST